MWREVITVVIFVIILKFLLSVIFKTKKEKIVMPRENREILTLKYNEEYVKFLKISNMFCIPIGLLAFIGVVFSIISNDVEDIGYIILTVIACLALFMMWQTVKNKKIIIENETIQIIRWLRKPLKIQRKHIRIIEISKNKAKVTEKNGKNYLVLLDYTMITTYFWRCAKYCEK